MKCSNCGKEKDKLFGDERYCRYCYNKKHESKEAKKLRLAKQKKWAKENRKYFRDYYWRPEIHETLKERYKLFQRKYRGQGKTK